MEVHDLTLRALAAEHDGYESANEVGGRVSRWGGRQCMGPGTLQLNNLLRDGRGRDMGGTGQP